MKQFDSTLGCDPEFFITDGGMVVGSETIIKSKSGSSPSTGGKIVVDGVQIELNPKGSHCRELLGRHIRDTFKTVYNRLKGSLGASFDVTVEIDRAKYNKMATKNKRFGCKPSFNINPGFPEVCTLDPSTYLKRSGGGHIHIGAESGEEKDIAFLQNAKEIVPMLDLIVGNTCVMLDRDPGNIERRKHYGRAGEYRLPPYGIEYRTLSNFWLRAFPLASIVLGLVRLAVDMTYSKRAEKLLAKVNYDDVVRAINENDFDLARSNWEKIKPSIIRAIDVGENQLEDYRYPIDKNNIDNFEKLIEGGINKYFPEDVFGNWLFTPSWQYGGYNFISDVIGGNDSVGWGTSKFYKVKKTLVRADEYDGDYDMFNDFSDTDDEFSEEIW